VCSAAILDVQRQIRLQTAREGKRLDLANAVRKHLLFRRDHRKSVQGIAKHGTKVQLLLLLRIKLFI
jgi:hypothetical protein